MKQQGPWTLHEIIKAGHSVVSSEDNDTYIGTISFEETGRVVVQIFTAWADSGHGYVSFCEERRETLKAYARRSSLHAIAGEADLFLSGALD